MQIITQVILTDKETEFLRELVKIGSSFSESGKMRLKLLSTMDTYIIIMHMNDIVTLHMV